MKEETAETAEEIMNTSKTDLMILIQIQKQFPLMMMMDQQLLKRKNQRIKK